MRGRHARRERRCTRWDWVRWVLGARAKRESKDRLCGGGRASRLTVLPQSNIQQRARTFFAFPVPSEASSLAKAAWTAEPRPASFANTVANVTAGLAMGFSTLAMRASWPWRPVQYGQVLMLLTVSMMLSIVFASSAENGLT